MRLFNPNTDSISDFYEKGKFLLAWRLMILFGTSFLILTIFSLLTSLNETLVYLACVVISVISLFVLYQTKKYKPVYYFLVFSGSCLAFYTLNNFNEILHMGDFLWLVLIIILAFFGLGIKFGFIVLGINLLNCFYYFTFTVEQNIPKITDLSFIVRLSLIIEVSTAILSITYLIYQLTLFHKYSYENLMNANKNLKDKNELILKQNLEKTSLVQEVHHRVKNNLQIIISLLRLQSNELKSLEAKKSLVEATNRIMVMSLIHQKLYGNKSLSNINLKEYLYELIDDIKNLYDTKDIKINIQSNYNVGLKTIVPLGLIFNELFTNTLKHAFRDIDNGEINIVIKQKIGRDFEVFYTDNGQWKEPTKKQNSFGLELIEIMTNQLEGHNEKVIDNNSTNYIFFLKDIDEEDKRPLKEQLNIEEII